MAGSCWQAEGVGPSRIVELRTPRVWLRAWRDTDRAPFAALNADPEVTEHFPNRLSRAQSDALADRISVGLAERGWGLWALEPTAAGTFAGFVGLEPVPLDVPFTPGAVEIGWRLARPWWGQGLATEAATVVLDFAFTTLKLDEVVSYTSATNLRSQAVMQRLGMTHDPTDDFDNPRIPAGHPQRRHLLYRIHRL